MRLLILGSNNEDSIEKYYLKYLKEFWGSNNVSLFASHDIFMEYYYKSTLNKILFRTGLSDIYININKAVIDYVKKNKPDTILIFKGMELFPGTIEFFKNEKIKIVNYNPDNPFLFTGRGSGNRNITNSIKYYDLFLTYDNNIGKIMQDEFYIKTAILPFGYELNDIEYQKYTNQTDEIIKTCFIGNEDKERLFFLNTLAENGIQLDLYGSWKRKYLHPNIKYCGKVPREELFRYFRLYRIQLNLMRIHNEQSHNMRTFEVPAVGGIQLAPHTDDHALFFKEGEEIFLYKSVEDCVVQIKKLLSLNKIQVQEIRDHARLRSVESKYSYQQRAIQLSQYINQKQ